MAVRLVDICANMLDGAFSGIYHGSVKHAADLDAVMRRAKAVGVEAVIVAAGSLAEARAARALCAEPSATGGGAWPRLAYTAGCHPTRTGEIDAFEGGPAGYAAALEAEVAAGVAAGSLCAVGEFGLDFDPDRECFSHRSVQLRHLDMHFALAVRHSLPVLLHDRDSGGLLAAAVRAAGPLPRGGVVHSFTGSAAELTEVLSLGLHVGINGCSLKTAEACAVAASVPLQRMLLETDAPYCSVRPTHAGAGLLRTAFAVAKKPERWEAGKGVAGRSEPGHVIHVAEVIAGLRGLTVADVARATTDNAFALFFPAVAALAATAALVDADVHAAHADASSPPPQQPCR